MAFLRLLSTLFNSVILWRLTIQFSNLEFHQPAREKAGSQVLKILLCEVSEVQGWEYIRLDCATSACL